MDETQLPPLSSPAHPQKQQIFQAIIITAIIVAALASVGTYVVIKSNQPKLVVDETKNLYPTFSPTLSPAPTLAMSNWKTYTNYSSLSFKYPPRLSQCCELPGGVIDNETIQIVSLAGDIDPNDQGSDRPLDIIGLAIDSNPQKRSLAQFVSVQKEKFLDHYKLNGGVPPAYPVSEEQKTINGVRWHVLYNYSWPNITNYETQLATKDILIVTKGVKNPSFNSEFDQILSTFTFLNTESLTSHASDTSVPAGYLKYESTGLSFYYPSTWKIAKDQYTSTSVRYTITNPSSPVDHREVVSIQQYDLDYFKKNNLDPKKDSDVVLAATGFSPFRSENIIVNNRQSQMYYGGGEGTNGWYVILRSGDSIYSFTSHTNANTVDEGVNSPFNPNTDTTLKTILESITVK